MITTLFIFKLGQLLVHSTHLLLHLLLHLFLFLHRLDHRRDEALIHRPIRSHG